MLPAEHGKSTPFQGMHHSILDPMMMTWSEIDQK
jgi:hypothetical protein